MIKSHEESLLFFTRKRAGIFLAKIDAKIINDFISTLEIPAEAKEELHKLTPMNYIGDAIKLARDI